MIRKLTATVALLVLSTGAFAGELVLTINGHQETVLRKVSKKRFEKLSVINTGTMSLDLISKNGSKNLQKQEVNPADEGGKFALEITGKNILKIEDEKENISTEVEANIASSILGTLRTIQVDGKIMDNVYAESYKKAGVDVLKSLNIGSGAIKSNIKTSDLSCVADGDLLKCQQDQQLLFSIGGI